MAPRILIVEQDEQVRRWLELHLSSLWPEACASCLPPDQQVIDLLTGTPDAVDLLLLSVDDGSQGRARLRWLRQVRRLHRTLPVLVIGSGGGEQLAVGAVRSGASHYLRRESLDTAVLGRGLKALLRRAARKQKRRDAPPESHPAGYAATRDQIPHYRLLRLLGGSHSASVWLARSDRLGTLVALKVGRQVVDEPEVRRQLAEERVALSALQHPSVVELLDYGVHEGREFLAMEYFPCGDLKQRLRNPLGATGALRYARRVAAALAVVHHSGMVHRDLKPHNIMLRADGSVVLIDFGLARALDSSTRRTAAGVLRGSPYYMSPEQARGETLDARSDLYSLGVLLYEMLAGRRPYSGNSPIELMQQHVAGNRPPLPDETSEYEPIVAQLMAVDRELRYRDAAAVADALDRLQGVNTVTNIRPVLAHVV